MDYTDKINSAIEYIEENICDEIDIEQAARRACCSVYHFERIFSFIADITPSEYIRRRRLTLAAFDLKNGSKVIDTALKYGYNSPEAFSRAFKKLHGVMPTAAKSGIALKAYPKLSFAFSAKGDTEIDYRITNKYAHTICGLKTEIPAADRNTNPMISRFWDECMKTGAIDNMHRDLGIKYSESLNAALFNFRQNMFSYLIYHEEAADFQSDKYTVISVPASDWVVFSTPRHHKSETTQLIRIIRKRIFLEWFPTSGYVHTGEPELEVFNRDGDYNKAEIWVPIKKSE